MDAVLSLYASGQTAGLVVQSGESLTLAVPIFEGFAVRKSVTLLYIGGGDIDNVLKRELQREGVTGRFPSSARHQRDHMPRC